MKIWLVMGNCGDYYCDGMHVLAVSDNEHGAKLLAEAAAKKPRYRTPHYDSGPYEDITVGGPLEVGELCPGSFKV